MSEKLKRFTDLMQEIFELDKSDLDFGIYRIMNIRKTEIEKFLTKRLPELVQETLKPFAQDDKESIRNRMAEIEQALGNVEAIPDSVPMKAEYIALKQQLTQGVDISALETDVYSALYSFFNRYYEEGDFISKRRYKDGVYAIPYEGEEVKLYWANQDQYYIKTSENFKDYSFTVGEYTVHFRLVDATTEQNNNKENKDKKRLFMLFTEDEENYPGVKTFEYKEEAKEFIIRFIYDIPEDNKKKYDELNYAAISEWLVKNRIPIWQDLLVQNIPSGKKGKMIDLLEKHLKGYVAKNTFDYFIHKDLRGFLSRELDFYIKSEVMHLDDLDTDHEERVESYLAKVKAIKRVGRIIIDFLAQIEEFQKKLWIKKKFVVETNWCMTLDKVDESFWQEIISNIDQINEWIALYAIDEAEGWTNPPTVDFLRQNQNLIIDTKHFSASFKERLIASVENLDEQTNGLMINGDNYHALSLLMEKGKGNIKGVFIDPPYNTEDDRAKGKFCYKDGYEDGSWMTMMNDRISLLRQLQSQDGLFFVTIGDDECYNLKCILDTIYGRGNFKANIIWNSRKSKQNDIDVSLAHNYVLSYSMNKNKEEFLGEPLNENEFSNPDNDPHGKWKVSPLDAPGIRERTSFYSIKNPNTGKEYFPPKGRHWTVFEEDVQGLIDDGRIFFGKKGITKPQGKRYWNEVLTDSKTISTLWDDVDTATAATTELENIMGEKGFETPKPVSLLKRVIQQACKENEDIIDCFAGSGTTGNATISLNREDQGNRKYILVEMGEYFNSVTKPRMQKVVYSTDWKGGKPQNRNNGISQIIKYMTLESYEDALSNIQLDNETHGMLGLFNDDYMIRYMLDLESQGSLLNFDAFRDPFSYRMKITEKNESKERSVDVIETFNYLIGLTVTHQGAMVSFTAQETAEGEYEGAIDLVKDPYGQYSFRQIEGTLPDGRRALVIWRTVSDNIIESNAALDAYFRKYRVNPADREYDVIYVNGDNNMENLRTADELWKVQMTELEFKSRMFEEE
ncbi:MAG: site-specific DNA-methyltransferase [Ruminococcus sp.]|nr:site-specific DNA-methyltransferase [Ruminococcus sp.]